MTPGMTGGGVTDTEKDYLQPPFAQRFSFMIHYSSA